MTMMLQRPDSTVRIEVLGEELRRLREASQLTLTEVVARIGISESHLSRIEKGKRVPSPEDVAALLVVYGVSLIALRGASVAAPPRSAGGLGG